VVREGRASERGVIGVTGNDLEKLLGSQDARKREKKQTSLGQQPAEQDKKGVKSIKIEKIVRQLGRLEGKRVQNQH